MRKFTIAWYQANPEYVAEQNRIYASQKSKPSAHKARAKRLNRMPGWVDELELKEVIKSCPPNLEIDHLFPLKGKLVSGLHTASNIQYLTATENRRKYNKFVPRRSIIYRATISLF
jgi:hypothetical protein